jgi:hypothetical protein
MFDPNSSTEAGPPPELFENIIEKLNVCRVQLNAIIELYVVFAKGSRPEVILTIQLTHP